MLALLPLLQLGVVAPWLPPDEADLDELAFDALVFEDLGPVLGSASLDDLLVDLPRLVAPLRSRSVGLWLSFEHRVLADAGLGSRSTFWVGLEVALGDLLVPAAGPLGPPRLERRRRARCRAVAGSKVGSALEVQARAARLVALGCTEVRS